MGRDHLSDFTTNLIKSYLLEYTQAFALVHIRPEQRARFRIERVRFDYDTRRWQSDYFELPVANGDYVILTPKEILTRDEAWINQTDLLDRFYDICASSSVRSPSRVDRTLELPAANPRGQRR